MVSDAGDGVVSDAGDGAVSDAGEHALSEAGERVMVGARTVPEERGLVVDSLDVDFHDRREVVPVLRHISFAVAPGEVVALLGPSGSGKSTLLRAIAGLEPVRAGDVRWDGESVMRLPVHQRGFGLMFQDGQLFPHRNVGANISYGISKEGREQRVQELLELVGLPGFGEREIQKLSGGERQRVALARSLAPAPRLLMLDEPLTALDRNLRERLTGDVAGILRQAGTTALYVTHDHGEARAVADRVGVLLDGRLVQVAAPEALWAAPANEAVAEFLGI